VLLLSPPPLLWLESAPTRLTSRPVGLQNPEHHPEIHLY
jgi:hypothetical protein